MKLQFVLTVFVISILSACENDNTSSPVTTGTYSGVFYRTVNGQKGPESEVTLTFSPDTYEGSGSIVKYPAICKGTYEVVGPKIKFENSCPWTAEFDWTLILSGEFEYRWENDVLILEKKYSEDMTDIYRLGIPQPY